MGLVTASRFATISEAHIAAGALRCHGLTAEVFDTQLGQTDWLIQTALGGFRLVVAEADLEVARRIVGSARAAAPPPVDRSAPVIAWWRRAAAALMAFLIG